MKTALFLLFLLTVVHGHPSNPDPSGPALRSARALPPIYLEVPGFQLCLDKKTVDSASSWCLPEHKPERCRAEHWTKLWSLGELCPCSQPGLDCSSEKNCCPFKEVLEGNLQMLYNFKEKRSPENPDCMDDCVYTSASDGEDYCFSNRPTYRVKCLNEDGPFPQRSGQCYNDTDIPKLYSILLILDGQPPLNKLNSPENCAAACVAKDSRVAYFGLESSNLNEGHLCYCGFNAPPSTRPSIHPIVDPSNCDVACPGNPEKMCGAYNFINVYSIPWS